MTVKPYERWVFHVQSCSGGLEHRVDLTAYWGNGWCDCHDFSCRHEPDVSRRTVWPSRCKHIEEARGLVLFITGIDGETLDGILKAEADKENQCEAGF